jgi:hypothetical protein
MKCVPLAEDNHQCYSNIHSAQRSSENAKQLHDAISVTRATGFNDVSAGRDVNIAMFHASIMRNVHKKCDEGCVVQGLL